MLKSLHDELNELFSSEAPPFDEIGALRALLDESADAGVIAVFAVGEHGVLLATVPQGGGDFVRAVRAAADALSRLPRSRTNVRLSGPPTAGAWSGAIRVRGAAKRAGFIGVLHRGRACERLLRILRTRSFRRLAAMAHAAASVVQERNLDRARSRQLEAEQAALRTAHAETVTAVLLEREEHAQARRRYIDELESEVQRRSAALREALARAEQASESKSQFLANMSHEIRTPMTAILGFAESLAEAGLSDAERKAAIETIHRNGKHLLDIINDILDLSKIEAGRLDAENVECQLPGLVADVLDLMHVRADARQLPLQSSIVGPCPASIETDPTRLRQILINLLGNAIKFTQAGSVRLEVRYEPSGSDAADPGQLIFDVIDTGIGIEPDQISRLFTPFSQADNSMTRRFGGTGLGLAISLRLARMLGGGIEVESRLGVGSRFRLRIAARSPRGIGTIQSTATARTPAPVQRTSTTPLVRGHSLLLAEDGPDNQRLISFILRRAGHSVSIVENGQAAVEAAQLAVKSGRPFAVILMDMQMPTLDGYGATRALRSAGYAGPIVALTAHAMTGDRERCLAAGCDEYASKPVDREKLLRLIDSLAAGALARSAGGDPSTGP